MSRAGDLAASVLGRLDDETAQLSAAERREVELTIAHKLAQRSAESPPAVCRACAGAVLRDARDACRTCGRPGPA